MKQIIILFLAVCLIGCHTKEDKIKQLIKESLYKSLHDAKSYEIIEFSKLDSVYTSYEESKEGSKNYTARKSILDKVKLNQSRYDDIKSENEISRIRYYTWYAGSKYDRAELSNLSKILAENKKLLSEYDDLELKDSTSKNAFKRQHIGWKVSHRFRAKNKLGNLGIADHTFYFNLPLDSITSSVDNLEDVSI